MTADLSLEYVTRPPLRYHGGKFRLAPWIISHLPEHHTYVEVFGGAAGVLLRKPRSKIEIYNDLDQQVVNLFRCLREPAALDRLAHLISLTPFSRDEFELAYLETDDPVEAARRFVLRTYMGHGTSSLDPRYSNGFRSCDIRAGKSYAREWEGIPEAIVTAAHRLQGVTIENLDFRKLMPKFEDRETLFYLDPPYLLSTRNNGGKGYVHELTDEDHRQLLWLARRSSAKILISGYPCRLYAELLKDWRHEEKVTSANGQRGAIPRTEVLWMKFLMPEQLELTTYRQGQSGSDPAAPDPDEVAQLVALLSAAGCWMSAQEILEQLGRPVNEATKRTLRELASESRGEIVSGNSGYKHTRHITPDELSEFWGRMVNQGKKMIARAILVKRRHHQLVG